MTKVKLFNKAVTSSFALEWSTKMSDFEPDYVYMIPVAYKRKETFFEEIITVPARIRGAFITDNEKKDKIYFSITSMNDTVLYEATTNENIFDFEIITIGRIKINFTFCKFFIMRLKENTFYSEDGVGMVMRVRKI